MTFRHFFRSALPIRSPALTALLLAAGLAAGLRGAGAQPVAAIEIAASELERLGVVFTRPEPSGGQVVLSAPAQTVVPPARETIVSGQLRGLVSRLLVAEGDEITVGQPLVELRSLALLDTQREYVDAVAQARLAEAQLERDRLMHQEGIIAARRLDETEAVALAAKRREEQARQHLRLAGLNDASLARLASGGEISTDLTLTSPIDGIVAHLHVAVGEQIDALEPVVRLADLRELWLEARVPQERADAVEAGMRLAVDVRGRTFEGEIFQVGRIVDAGTQTVLVRAAVVNEDLALRAGQLIPARILAAERRGTLAVPMSSIARVDGQAFVFARDTVGLRAVPVTIVGETADRVQIEAGGGLDSSTEIAGRGVSAIKALLTSDEE